MTSDNGLNIVGEKQLPEPGIRRSVIAPQEGDPLTLQGGAGGLGDILYFIGNAQDEIRPWGTLIGLRDRQLRHFISQETITLSALGTIIARNAALSWKLTGPGATVNRVMDVLHGANFGKGWEEWATTTGWDYYGQDKGAITELVREEDNPRAPVIGMNQLDAGRCWHTGRPDLPVLYLDRKGRYHALQWYQVITLAEMPSPFETLYGLQYSAITRILRIVQIMRNILLLNEERTGGRHTRAIHVVSGVKKGEIEDAIRLKQRLADAQGLMRWIEPVIMTPVDPGHTPSLVTLDLASLPDNFDFGESMRWYMTAIAMGLLSDVQEFMPLPGGNLGSSAQSQILHLKTRGKGPALWQKKVEHAFNFMGIIPSNCHFEFDEDDLEEDKTRVDILNTLATAFKLLLDTDVLDVEAVQKLMLQHKFIDQQLLDDMQQRAIEKEMLGELDALTQPEPVAEPPPVPGAPAAGPPGTMVASDMQPIRSARALRLTAPSPEGPDADRLEVEAAVEDRVGKALGKLMLNIRRRVER